MSNIEKLVEEILNLNDTGTLGSGKLARLKELAEACQSELPVNWIVWAVGYDDNNSMVLEKIVSENILCSPNDIEKTLLGMEDEQGLTLSAFRKGMAHTVRFA